MPFVRITLMVAAWSALAAGAPPAKEKPAASAPATRPALHSRVDPRVELLSLIFRLAGSEEYNQPSSKSPYSADADKHFEKFRDHPVVLKARELTSRDSVSFDAVMGMAVHVDNVQSLKERVAFDSPECKLDKRWKPEEARAFLKLARDFVKESEFQKFFEEHRPLYAEAARRMDRCLVKNDPIAWFDSFFGARPQASFEVFLGMLNGGGCYGMSIQLPGGQEEITPVIGVWKFDAKGLPVFGDGILPTLIHEFCHAYTNAIVEKHARQMEPAAKRLFKLKEKQMQQQAYGDPKTLLCESMVRACVVRCLRAKHGQAKAQQEIREQRQCGFEWVGDLSDLLGQYEAARDKYPTFDSFMPQVVKAFDGYAKKAEELATRKPKVISITPTNGAQDVDPKLTEMKITFDRPMKDGSWAIVRVSSNFPELVGKPHYDKDRKVLAVDLRLEPNREYELWLNQGEFSSFMSAEGVLLDPVAVTFKTRGE